MLLVTEAQVSKTIQLYNTMLVRHGVMQVGGTSGGKTTSRTILAHALAKLANSQPQFNQNSPPAVSVELYIIGERKRPGGQNFTAFFNHPYIISVHSHLHIHPTQEVVTGTCFHTFNCHCVNPSNRIKMERAKTASKKSRLGTALGASLDPDRLEMFTKALGLNSRFAAHRNIRRQARSRANSIVEIKRTKVTKFISYTTFHAPSHGFHHIITTVHKSIYDVILLLPAERRYQVYDAEPQVCLS